MSCGDDQKTMTVMIQTTDELWYAAPVTADTNQRLYAGRYLDVPSLIPGIELAAVEDELGIPDTVSVDTFSPR